MDEKLHALAVSYCLLFLLLFSVEYLSLRMLSVIKKILTFIISDKNYYV